MSQPLSMVMQEVTPLTDADCLLVFSRIKDEFAFPLHMHQEYELNFIQNARGAQRIVGDSIETIDDWELTLITGSQLEHAWLTHECKSDAIREITIQFHNNMLSDSLLTRNSFQSISKLFNRAKQGVTFSGETIQKIQPRLETLAQKADGIDAVLQFISILHELSVSPNIRMLSSNSISDHTSDFESRRIEKLYVYMGEHYKEDIRLAEVSALVGMSEVAFCRFIKQRTGKTFVDVLNEIRLGHVVRLLISTTQTISEICYSCGFNNISNFNRLFLKKKKCTPSQLRGNYVKNRVVI